MNSALQVFASLLQTVLKVFEALLKVGVQLVLLLISGLSSLVTDRRKPVRQHHQRKRRNKQWRRTLH
ncbi:hypothetical protein GFL93_09475 [Rhizobium leguminosarum bv. viciae]|uniref:hypothetical protein n=1 Tax=Rhizobium TaxID=379 RepID=UPI0014426011|nr:hypothetical protein [Rhizobium leguminosarum]NKK06101.1 hypothetical protein [Rhizobium leguminosarum bv. viciae]